MSRKLFSLPICWAAVCCYSFTVVPILRYPMRASTFKKCTGALDPPISDVTYTEKSRLKVTYDGNELKAHSLKTLLSDVLRLLSPVGSGQLDDARVELHATGSKRPYSDTMMWTHAFFFVGSVTAFLHGLTDLLLLNTITAFLSMKYHEEYEKPGRIAQLEGTFAKALFLYGAIQILQSPSHLLRGLEIVMFSMTATIFLITNIRKQLYNSLHFLMHVIPPIWVTLVACTHKPLIPLPFV